MTQAADPRFIIADVPEQVVEESVMDVFESIGGVLARVAAEYGAKVGPVMAITEADDGWLRCLAVEE